MAGKNDPTAAYQQGFKDGYELGLRHGQDRQRALQAGMVSGRRHTVASAGMVDVKRRTSGEQGTRILVQQTNAERIRTLLRERPGPTYGEIKDALDISCAQKAYRMKDVVRTRDGRFWLVGTEPQNDYDRLT